MKRKDLIFFRVHKSAKNCKRVRKDVKRKGMGDRESMTQFLKVRTPSTPPSIAHDYQRKRLPELAIHKCLILNDMFLAVWEEQEPKD